MYFPETGNSESGVTKVDRKKLFVNDKGRQAMTQQEKKHILC